MNIQQHQTVSGGRRRAIIQARANPQAIVAPAAPAPAPAPVVAPPAQRNKGGRPKRAGHPDYLRARPWPHMVVDGFLPDDLAEEAYLAFPAADDPIWREHGREFTGGDKARKLEMSRYEAMPAPLRAVVDLIHGEKAMAKLATLTGFDDLICDPSLLGGGLNLAEPGGFLKSHADFNWNEALKAYRTVNLLIYLNPDWSEGDGGELELWATKRCTKQVAPAFNRAVIFTTTDNAVHGYGPVKAARRSMNFYFYRKEPAKGIAPEPRKTLWAE